MQFVIFGITSQEILKIKQNRSSGDWKSCKNIENLNLAKMRCRNKERNFATDTNKVNILKNVPEKKSDRKHNFWIGSFFDFHHHIPWFFFKIAYVMISNSMSQQLEKSENLNLSKIDITTRERNFCHGHQQSEPI